VRKEENLDVLRYYFDEHLPYLAEPLREREIDVLTTQEAQRANRGISDPDQLAYASGLGRVVVTKDADFADLAYHEPPHAGIVWLHKEDSIGKYLEFLEYTALVLEPDEAAVRRLIYYQALS
jgi:predicted nuclease of predicted toxin-antitoxin system